MFPNNCTFLPQKSKSSFNGSTPHGFKLPCNSDAVSNISVSTFLDSCGYPHMETVKQGTSDHGLSVSRTSSLMSLVYSLGEYSRKGLGLKNNTGMPNLLPVKSRQSKSFMGLPHHNNTSSSPFLSSHLIGGFVGSKSQLSRRPAQGIEVKMWDIIRDLLLFVDHSTISSKQNKNRSQMEKPSIGILTGNKEQCRPSSINCIKNSTVVLNLSENMELPKKQTYADVTKSKLSVAKDNCDQTIQQCTARQSDNREEDRSKTKSVIESIPMCSNNCSPSKRRIASESSADSDDSFIVFEYCEGDYNIGKSGGENDDDDYDDDDDDDDLSNTSDDFSLMGFPLNGDCSLENDHEPNQTTLNESCESSVKKECSLEDECESNQISLNKFCKSSSKKVRFAEGKSLSRVHKIIAWDYAYRSARRGPWEMLARDSERFKCRIANLEAKLTPVLSLQHRQQVYQERFAS